MELSNQLLRHKYDWYRRKETPEARDILVRLGAPGIDRISHDGVWDADHIVPVVEGGGECGLDNYRTLCLPCHRKVTAQLRARIAWRKGRRPISRTPCIEIVVL